MVTRNVIIALALTFLMVFQLSSISQPVSINENQSTSSQIWFNDSPASNSFQEFEEDLDELAIHLERKRYRYSEVNYLRWVYYKIHRKYLKKYQTPSTLADLHEKRTYDCLTGTALYAMVFQRLGIPVEIVETTHHVYLTVQAGDQKVVIESTSPLDGFIADPELVEKAIQVYQRGESDESWGGPDYYKPSNAVNNIISLTELAGLQYYNQAVIAYNQRDLKTAYDKISEAFFLYPSERLKEMMVIMLNTISSDSGVDPLLARQAQARFGYLRQLPIASNNTR